MQFIDIVYEMIVTTNLSNTVYSDRRPLNKEKDEENTLPKISHRVYCIKTRQLYLLMKLGENWSI